MENRLEQVIKAQAEIAAASQSFQDVLQVVACRAQELLRADGAVVELAEGEEMVYRAVSGTADGQLGLRLRRAGTLSGLSLQLQDVLVCGDSETDPRMDLEACRRVGLRSMVVVPLNSGDSTLGVLKVLSGEPDHFSAEDAGVLTLLSSIVGAAMTNARAYESSSRRAEDFAHMATHDPLTGLPNRALIHDRLRHLCAVSERNGTRFGVLLLDVDGFKGVNDSHGHQAGDEALRCISSRLEQASRRSDLAGRLSGDEFVVLLSPPVDEAALEQARQRFAAAVRCEVDGGTRKLTVSASVGAALSEDNCEPEQVLRAADAAMYESKRAR